MDINFEEFVEAIQRGDDKYYMTTQSIPENEFGFDDLFVEPLVSLQDDFPLRPSLFQSLGNQASSRTLSNHFINPSAVPYQMNLWLGNSKNGSSSGLHHDFHDNLYILLNGKKRFTLVPPQFAKCLYTKGKVSKIHTNGLINYSGLSTRVDGAHPNEIAKFKSRMAEQELANAEKELEDFKNGTGTDESLVAAAEQRLEIAEENLNQVLEDVLSCETDDRFVGHQVIESSHFSDIPITPKGIFCPENRKRFPKTKTIVPIECNICEGQMLYLPASWFHEVTSFATSSFHMAFNYWFYPPMLDARIEAPYPDRLWESHWAEYQQSANEPPQKRQKVK